MVGLYEYIQEGTYRYFCVFLIQYPIRNYIKKECIYKNNLVPVFDTGTRLFLYTLLKFISYNRERYSSGVITGILEC